MHNAVLRNGILIVAAILLAACGSARSGGLSLSTQQEQAEHAVTGKLMADGYVSECDAGKPVGQFVDRSGDRVTLIYVACAIAAQGNTPQNILVIVVEKASTGKFIYADVLVASGTVGVTAPNG